MSVLSVCHEIRLLKILFSKSNPTGFFILGTTNEAINTYQIVKSSIDVFRHVFWALFRSELAKKRTLDIFLDNGAIENINTSQLAKTASKLIHFSRSYGPKRV